MSSNQNDIWRYQYPSSQTDILLIMFFEDDCPNESMRQLPHHFGDDPYRFLSIVVHLINFLSLTDPFRF